MAATAPSRPLFQELDEARNRVDYLKLLSIDTLEPTPADLPFQSLVATGATVDETEDPTIERNFNVLFGVVVSGLALVLLVGLIQVALLAQELLPVS